MSSGSSPREWGTHISGRDSITRHRFIPTRVGNTNHTSLQASANPVHPHASGEHVRSEAAIIYYLGSSPREWGTPLAHASSRQSSRFIPTRVGNTAVSSAAAIASAVHPHASGEHPNTHQQPANAGGSSPREWGTRSWDAGASLFDRFIPTRVGNTTPSTAELSSTTVHPHASGEHRWPCPRRPQSDGSSPREWGTQICAACSPCLTRFIPTRVGNTDRVWL